MKTEDRHHIRTQTWQKGQKEGTREPFLITGSQKN